MTLSVNLNSVPNITFRAKKQGENAQPQKTDIGGIALKTGVGALALLGAIGVADVALCKGKHLSNLNREYSELSSNLAIAEQKLAKSEAKAAEAKERLAKAESKISEYIDLANSKEAQVNEANTENMNLKMKLDRLRLLETSYPNILEWFQARYADLSEMPKDVQKFFGKRIKSILRQNGYDLHDDASKLSDKKYLSMFSQQPDVYLTSPELYAPAITNSKTGKVVLPGVVHVPAGK